jgi:DNA-binding CsgD family transcriptional regulator
VAFIFCFAIAIASILIGHRFVLTYGTNFHRNYLYYLITFYGFALYAIWGQILIRVLLTSIDTGSEQIGIIANFLPVLGVPFLLISWVMLLKMGHSLIEASVKTNLLRVHIVIFLVLVPLVWASYTFWDKSNWPNGQKLAYLQVGIISFIEMVYMILFITTIYRGLKTQGRSHPKIVLRFTWLILLAFLIRLLIIPFQFESPWIIAPLILVYFLSNFLPLFYLKLNSDLAFTPIHAENPVEEKKALIYKKYEISKREREIVEHICKGKTNQQIADDLFISLQTVKDHTHRIYTKIGINSRMKLVQLVNG